MGIYFANSFGVPALKAWPLFADMVISFKGEEEF